MDKKEDLIVISSHQYVFGSWYYTNNNLSFEACMRTRYADEHKSLTLRTDPRLAVLNAYLEKMKDGNYMFPDGALMVDEGEMTWRRFE